jgi:Mature-T-Cell Proliferation I type
MDKWTMTERQWTLHQNSKSDATASKNDHCGDEQQQHQSSSTIPIEQIKCKKEACAIQYCFKRHDFSEEKCKSFWEEWQACAARARRKHQQEQEQHKPNDD